jgi:hypothetical protein
MIIFRNKTNISIIKGFRVTTIIEDIESVVRDVSTYNVPISLKKLGSQTIWARGTIAFELVNSLRHFSSTKILIQQVMHLRGHPVGHSSHRFRDVGRIRRGEDVGEIVHKSTLNLLVVSSPVSLLVNDKINLILSLSLRSFVMEKLRVFVTMLEPMGFSSLSPPGLLYLHIAV